MLCGILNNLLESTQTFFLSNILHKLLGSVFLVNYFSVCFFVTVGHFFSSKRILIQNLPFAYRKGWNYVSWWSLKYLLIKTLWFMYGNWGYDLHLIIISIEVHLNYFSLFLLYNINKVSLIFLWTKSCYLISALHYSRAWLYNEFLYGLLYELENIDLIINKIVLNICSIILLHNK